MSGTIAEDKRQGVTMVYGIARLTIINMIGLLLSCLLFLVALQSSKFQQANFSEQEIMLSDAGSIILLSFMIYSVWAMYSKRNSIIRDIEYAIDDFGRRKKLDYAHSAYDEYLEERRSKRVQLWKTIASVNNKIGCNDYGTNF